LVSSFYEILKKSTKKYKKRLKNLKKEVKQLKEKLKVTKNSIALKAEIKIKKEKIENCEQVKQIKIMKFSNMMKIVFEKIIFDFCPKTIPKTQRNADRLANCLLDNYPMYYCKSIS
jgi:predicted nuclease with TOPRIM domain